MLRESPIPSLVEENGIEEANLKCSLIQLDFVKSPLTINPCMVHIQNTYFHNFYLLLVTLINNNEFLYRVIMDICIYKAKIDYI